MPSCGPGLTLCPVPFPRSARELDKVRQQLQEEARQLGTQLLEERKKRETHEALARRLQKRVLLLTKVRARAGGRRVLRPGQQRLSHPPRAALIVSLPAPHTCQITTKPRTLSPHTSWASPLGPSESAQVSVHGPLQVGRGGLVRRVLWLPGGP